ncbi:Extra-large guanine nucleotide-binding protein 1-like protein [Drosera capensis]
MSPVVAESVDYSFAVEYNGPPVSFDIPQAVPINVEKIPVASIVAQAVFPAKMSLPVVQPVLAPDTSSRKLSKELNVGSDTNVSPTSVMEFERNGFESAMGGVEMTSEATVSPNSITGFAEKDNGGQGCAMQGASCSTVAMGFFNGCQTSVINSSSELGCSSTSRELSNELLDGAGSSCTFEYCDSFGKSQDLSGVLRALGVSSSLPENSTVDDLNPPDWPSSKSLMSVEYPSSMASSFRSGGCNSMPNCDFRRGPFVTLHDIDSNNDPEGTTYSETGTPRSKKETLVKAKKGACYRCSKAGRFTEKEVCLVCNAKYCINCVLRAMGSMPEGRKCVSCISYPIDESKRGNLGKCSKMLKRLLNDLEIRQVMQAEKFCDVNQLPAEYVYVNGKSLSPEELTLLQSCPNPPKSLKPGKFWYDKVSGLWGKEGHKPSQIISPHLNVGDPMKPDASMGNTQVFINGREITKAERRMLQLTGVQCAGNPHFWVNEDGSYQEEGQKNTKGYIWGKAGAKLACALLSLPIPSKAIQSYGEQMSPGVSRNHADYVVERTLEKILLVGYNESGTSTIFKQLVNGNVLVVMMELGLPLSTLAKILYKSTPFEEDERTKIKVMIQGNLYRYLGVLLEGREHFEEECLLDPKMAQSSDQAGQRGRLFCQLQCFLGLVRDGLEYGAEIVWGSLSEPVDSDQIDICEAVGTNEGNENRTIYSICRRLKAFSDWVLKTLASGDLEKMFLTANREYAPLVEELWNNGAIQATYERRSELEKLPGVANYFFDRAVDILREDYAPSDLDILYAEGVMSSNGLACVEFSFPQSVHDESSFDANRDDSLLRYQLVRVQGRGLAENCKWLEMLEDARLVTFCVSLSDYDQFSVDVNGALTNKMMLAKRFFESIISHPTFEHMDFLLLLNKYDLFEQKVETNPLSQCEWFEDFHPVLSRSQHTSPNKSGSDLKNPNTTSVAQLGFHHVAVKFKRLYSQFTGRKLYVSLVKGLEPARVNEALKYASEILKWDDERNNFSFSDYSVYSTEANSFSP